MGSEADDSYNYRIEGIVLETSASPAEIETDCMARCLLKKILKYKVQGEYWCCSAS